MPPPSDTIEFPIDEVIKGLIEMFWAFSPLYPYFIGLLVFIALMEWVKSLIRPKPKARKPKPDTTIYIVNQNTVKMESKENKK